MTASTYLSVQGMTVSYRRFRALSDVDLAVQKGAVVGLVGPSGAGKTTMLRTIAGLVKPESGTITVAEERIDRQQAWRRSRLGIAYCSPENRVFPALSVGENLEIGARDLRRRPDPKVLDYIYDVFAVLRDRHSQRAGALSGGEQQMLTIGRSLMAKPKLLLLDEPRVPCPVPTDADIAQAVAALRAAGLDLP